MNEIAAVISIKWIVGSGCEACGHHRLGYIDHLGLEDGAEEERWLNLTENQLLQ